MNLIAGHVGREQEVCEFFQTVFTASEGEEEGRTIGSFVRELMRTTPADDLLSFFAEDDGSLIGGVFFSRMIYPNDPRTLFILSPMAVGSARQGEGIGQQLAAFGLQALRSKGVDGAFTYGDPNFYGRVGFRQVSEAFAPAPFTLSQPIGWLARSLTEEELDAFAGTPRCVEALNKAELW